MNDLQIFIEDSIGKCYGDKYNIGHTLIKTSITHPMEPFRVTVSLSLFGNWVFSDTMDSREIDDNIKFYDWLKGTFIPNAEQSYKKYIIKAKALLYQRVDS